MRKNQVIGISGVAGCGKDLFSSSIEQELTSKGFKVKKLSLAAALKSEVRQWCIENYNIDSIDCNRQDKEKIRDFLVFHGTTKRNTSKGRHWIDVIDLIIKMEKDNYDYLRSKKKNLSWLKFIPPTFPIMMDSPLPNYNEE